MRVHAKPLQIVPICERDKPSTHADLYVSDRCQASALSMWETILTFDYFHIQAKAAYDGSESCRILDPEDVGKAVLYAVSQPEHVGVNEILIEPRENPI